MALGAKVINFVGLGLLNYSNKVACISKVAVMQGELGMFFMRILVDVVDALCIKKTCSSFKAMDLVALFKK